VGWGGEVNGSLKINKENPGGQIAYLKKVGSLALRGRGERMSETYKIEYEGGILKIGFGSTPAQNDRLVRDAEKRLKELIENGTLKGGELIKINGPASLPVCAVLVHNLCHLFAALAIFDPKLGRYVVCVTHSPKYKLGDLID
jgi:CRISPR-associated protein Csx3